MPRLLLLLLLATVYGLTLQPGLGPTGDSAELQFTGWYFAPSHPTGYPLYTLLLGCFVHALPLGELAWRANLFSALLAVGAVGLLDRILREEGLSPWASALTALAFGLTRTFWFHAGNAEVYALHALLTLAICQGALEWRRDGRPQALGRAAFFWALAMAHHVTSVILLPGLIFLVGWPLPWKVLAKGLLPGALVTGALYAWLGTRFLDPDVPWINNGVSSWAGALRHFSGLEYGPLVYGWSGREILGSRVPWLLYIVVQQVGPLLPACAWGLWRSRWDGRAWCLLWGLGLGAFALGYKATDPEVYLLPAWIGVAISAGWGIRDLYGRKRILAALLLAFPVLALPPYNLRHTWHPAMTRTEDKARKILEIVGEDAAVVAAEWEDVTPLWYLRHGEGRPLEVVYLYEATPPWLVAYLEDGVPLPLLDARRDLAPGRRVYAVTPRVFPELKALGLDLEWVAPGIVRLGPRIPPPAGP